MHAMKRTLIGGAVFAVLAWTAWRFSVVGSPPEPAPARPDSVSTGLRAARLFFASSDGDSLVSESRDLAETGALHERVVSLIGELVRGPHGPAVAALPAGTSLVHVYLDDQGLMTLDFSPQFARSFRGGSTAEYMAVASLVRTLAANVPEVRRVLIESGGQPLATLGGHVPCDQPFEVQDWP
jgi:spore germination protein GerM